MNGENTPPAPQYVRIWRGRTTKAYADAYERYWLENGIKPLEEKGALSIQMLRDDAGEQTEFVTPSYWPSIEAMTGAKGGDPRLLHHLERDPEFLVEVPRTVQILKVLAARSGEAQS